MTPNNNYNMDELFICGNADEKNCSSCFAREPHPHDGRCNKERYCNLFHRKTKCYKIEVELFICDSVNDKCESCAGRYPHVHTGGCNKERFCYKMKRDTKCIPYVRYKIELPKELFEI